MTSTPAAEPAGGRTRARTRPPVARERSERTRRARSGDPDLSAGDWSPGDKAERAVGRFSAGPPEAGAGAAARPNGRTARRARLDGSPDAAGLAALRAARFTVFRARPRFPPPSRAPAFSHV